MFLSGNLIRFFICYATAFAAFSLIGKWYLWPAIKDRSLKIALTTPLLLYACLRVNGLDVPDARSCLTEFTKRVRRTDSLLVI